MRFFKLEKKAWSWAIYDWANSACATTIMVAFVPLFLKDYWSIGTDPTLTTARLGIANSVTSILVAVMSPFLGALADLRGYKKIFCLFFMIIGVLSSIALAFVDKGQWLLALTIFGITMVGFNASLVFYDSLLPSVSTKKNSNDVSSLGFSLGYLGGGVLFLINIVMCMKPQWFGLNDIVEAVKASFISVGIWWLIFSIPLMKNVPEPKTFNPPKGLRESINKSFSSLWETLLELKDNKNLLFFLLAYWLYIDGVFTVMTMAVDYGKSLNLDSNAMMAALLLVQFLGFPFSLLFSKFANLWGCRIPILITIFAYGLIVILASWISQSWHFFALSVVIGMVQGGVQSLSRSLFSQMIPAEKSGEYFGLFNLVGKFAAILGPLIVGLGAYLTGNPRFGMLGLLVLFVAGGGLLFLVKEPTTRDA
jgi:UMF1 family MFS transporter